jgi:hypothetical protein
MALQTLAAEGGSIFRAVRALAEEHVSVSEPTLYRWRDRTHAEEYLTIRDTLQGAEQRRLAARQEDLSRKGADVTEKLWKRLEDEIDELPARDLPGAVRNAATALGISTDKVLATRERPVAMPAENRDIGEIVRKLVGMKVASLAPPLEAPDATTASIRPRQLEPTIEVTDADVVEEPAPSPAGTAG